MPYNTLKLAVAVALPLAFCAHAGTWQQSLKHRMDNDYAALNRKVEICKQQATPLKKIDQSWFIKLNKQQKYAAASYLNWMVKKRCYQPEWANYAASLLAYTAETGQQQVLNQWLPLAQVYRPKNLEKSFQQLDVTPIQNYFAHHPNIAPFNIMNFLQQYPEFSPKDETN